VISYSRYSHHARRALTHANLLVIRYRHAQVDTSHLLVGVLLTEGSIGCQVLRELKIDPQHAREHLKGMYVALERAPETSQPAPSLDEALDLAANESAWLGHHYIGTEHLLLGMTRMNVGDANALLRALNISPEQVRRRVRRTVSDGITELDLQVAKKNARLSELSRRVINAAEQLAVALDHATVGLGHLLLVLLQEERSSTANILRAEGLDEQHLREDMESGEASLLVTIEIVLNRALDQAESLGSHYTGTEHLLLTMTVDPIARAVLQRYRIDPLTLQQRLENHLKTKK
jgi:ATP-dependent Clp protease ATP-binding subunit ClpA